MRMHSSDGGPYSICLLHSFLYVLFEVPRHHPVLRTRTPSFVLSPGAVLRCLPASRSKCRTKRRSTRGCMMTLMSISSHSRLSCRGSGPFSEGQLQELGFAHPRCSSARAQDSSQSTHGGPQLRLNASNLPCSFSSKSRPASVPALG